MPLRDAPASAPAMCEGGLSIVSDVRLWIYYSCLWRHNGDDVIAVILRRNKCHTCIEFAHKYYEKVKKTIKKVIPTGFSQTGHI